MAKLTRDELIKRDQDRNIGEEILQAVRDIKAGKIGRIRRGESELIQLVRTRAKERRIKVELDDL